MESSFTRKCRIAKASVHYLLAELEKIHDQSPLNEEEMYAKTAKAMEF